MAADLDKLYANARRMRHHLTDAELTFWNAVRAHRLEGLGFRRQVPIAGYIADFACPARRLVVEIDGSQHGEDEAYDARRTRQLAEAGWTVLRFWNHDVLHDLDNVCRHVLKVAGIDTV